MTSTDRAIGPEIEGLTYLEHLGSGGYSDVYLYERRKPRMRVAVKVLTDARLSEAELRQFAAEAETMAELADHPYIVQVFSTGTTADGRPYLVMKYYPPPNLARRAATERFTVAEVLRTGIQISSAVETAHRAGIVHRDIKPANILISQYGEPGLADFGIAGNAAETAREEDLGVSIPWSPPEVLTGASNGSVASDIYSLAATLWHLLAGRSPHEVPGGDNSPRALMGRILKLAPPATGRADAPASLERLLQQAMSKNPEHRPASALEFARSLQMIEQELRYARTEIVVDGAAPAPPLAAVGKAPDRSEPPTRAKPAVAAPEPPTRAKPVTAAPVTAKPAKSVAAPPEPVTVRRPSGPSPATADAEQETAQPQAARRARALWYVGGAAAVVVAGLVATVATVVAVSGGSHSGSSAASAAQSPSSPVGSDQAGLSATSAVAPTMATPIYDAKTQTLTFRWSAPAVDGKPPRFVYSFGDGKQVGPTTATSASIKTSAPATTCITVGTVDDKTGEQVPTTACGA